MKNEYKLKKNYKLRQKLKLNYIKMKKKIFIILPYKESLDPNSAGQFQFM